MLIKSLKFFVVFIIQFVAITSLIAQTDSISSKKINIEYTNKGFQFSTPDKNFALHIESRFQFRFSTPYDQNPVIFDDFNTERSTGFNINRARLKIGGNAYKPWLKYYMQYDLANNRLLDLRVMIERWQFFNVQIGQFKTHFGRERYISSGKQQMMDRSIINRPFTIDMQQGVEFYGRVFPKTLADFTYHISVLTGTGRGAKANDDNHLMYIGRLQWNMFGRELKMSGSDVSFHEKPTGLLAFAASTNRGSFTRFSSSGGGQLEGFVNTESGQFHTNQALLETAFKYRGFSWQHESHIKEINDYVTHSSQTLTGFYVQAGYFLSNIIDFVPENLEMAGVFANYNPDVDIKNNLQKEYGLAFNYFFQEHRNKLSMEVTHFSYDYPESFNQNEWRFRLQWDISF
ncbi:OprO/OprP family phosphate-selective porin [Bizionia myxarmorum]|uniref:Porin n=1 Tax=Bizionia myxarmorum TaxID=291186 RepID=A0A5D0R6Y5_9FLAO|nr:porin [Bizionia myxarmorum]TYB76314.1 porin [Bizionia myxarmorum]